VAGYGPGMSEMVIDLDGETYVLRRNPEGIQVGRRTQGEMAWLDTVDPELLSADAREALDRCDTSDAALLTAVRGVVTAEVERGG
jgi:hypothetical protein